MLITLTDLAYLGHAEINERHLLKMVSYGVGICRGSGNRHSNERNEFGGVKPSAEFSLNSPRLPPPGHRGR